MLQFVLLVLCIVTFVAADFLAARWGYLHDRRSLVLALIIGPFAYVLFGLVAAQTSMARMGGYVNGGVVLGTALVGVVWLGEKPDRTTWIGLALVVVGLMVLGFGKVERVPA